MVKSDKRRSENLGSERKHSLQAASLRPQQLPLTRSQLKSFQKWPQGGRFQQMIINFANDFFLKRHSPDFPFWKIQSFFKKVLRKRRQIDWTVLNFNLIWLANDENSMIFWIFNSSSEEDYSLRDFAAQTLSRSLWLIFSKSHNTEKNIKSILF